MSQRSHALKEIPKSNIALAENSLRNARSDLKSAKALYDSACYSHAIYHLQQSLEKGWKSFGFYYGIITEGQARSKDIIGHKGSKVCLKTISAFKKVVSHMRIQVKAIKNVRNSGKSDQLPLALNDEHLKELDDGIDVIIRELNNFAANEEKLRNMPYDEMKRLVDSLTEFQRALDDIELKLDSDQFKGEHFEKIRQGTYRFWRPLVMGHPHAEEMLRKHVWEELSDEMIRDLMKGTLCGMAITPPLFQLAVITQVHEQTTRYGIGDLPPESIYTETHPVIQLFPQIYSLSETSLINLEKFYTEFPMDESASDDEVSSP